MVLLCPEDKTCLTGPLQPPFLQQSNQRIIPFRISQTIPSSFEPLLYSSSCFQYLATSPPLQILVLWKSLASTQYHQEAFPETQPSGILSLTSNCFSLLIILV